MSIITIMIIRRKEEVKTELMNPMKLVIKRKDFPLAIIGLLLRMRLVRPMRGMSTSTVATTIGTVSRMSFVFGVLEVDSDF